jgi:hypothetical protein
MALSPNGFSKDPKRMEWYEYEREVRVQDAIY